MNKFKRIISYVLVLAVLYLLLSPNVVIAASQQKFEDLDQLIDIAINESITIKLIDEKIKNAENRLSYAIRNASIKKNENWVTDKERAELKKIVELVPVQKKNTVEVLKLEKIEKVNMLKMDITKAYSTYLLTQEQIKNQQRAIDGLKKKLEVVKVQVSKGMAKIAALDSIEITLKTAEQQFALLSRDLSNNSINLNSLLGRPLKSTIVLSEREVPVPSLYSSIEDITNNKIANSSHMLQTLNNMTEAKIEYDITNFSSTNVIPDGLEQAENKLLDASFDYKDLLQNIECNVLNDYNNLLNLQDDVNIKKLQVEISIKELVKAKVQYERGLIDIITYNSVTQSFENSEIAYKKAKLDYFISVEKFIN